MKKDKKKTNVRRHKKDFVHFEGCLYKGLCKKLVILKLLKHLARYPSRSVHPETTRLGISKFGNEK